MDNLDIKSMDYKELREAVSQLYDEVVKLKRIIQIYIEEEGS